MSNKKHKKMIENYTTQQLLSMIVAAEPVYTPAQCVEELQARTVPNDYEDEAMRGGIRPTRPQ